MWKKPARLTLSAPAIVGLGVIGERLGDEDAGVVDQRVDAAEPRHGFRDHALGGLGIGDVAGDGQDVVIVRRLDRARGGDDAVVAVAIRLHQGRADALRCAGNDCDFLFGTHCRLLSV